MKAKKGETKYNLAQLEKLYWEQGLSFSEIGKLFGVTNGAIHDVFARFSIPSKEPNYIYNPDMARRKAEKLRQYFGENTSNWKGGIRYHHGYRFVYNPSHHRSDGTYVAEHILVWEKAHNKPLPKGYVIHHLNGTKDDNRPENLIALHTQKHFHVLRKKSERITTLEARITLLEAEVTLLRTALEKGQFTLSL